MNLTNHLLIIPKKPDTERTALATAWKNRNGEVLKIDKFWKKPVIRNQKVALYGFDTFCLILAQLLELNLVAPCDEWIAALDKKWTKRDLSIKETSAIKEDNLPAFIKPVQPKLFQAKVYTTIQEFKETTVGLDLAERIIYSEIISVEKEVRAFILEGKVQDLAFYEGEGNKVKPRTFLEEFLKNTRLNLPKTYVLDLGYNKENGWFILEFNATWGAGLNGCEAEKVVSCIAVATQ